VKEIPPRDLKTVKEKTVSAIPGPPRGTGTEGRRLWRAVLKDFDLNEHELTLLRQAVRVADLCSLLQALVDEQGPIVGEKAHPALVELRQQRILLARLVVALRVPIGEQEDAARTQHRGVRGVYGIKGGVA
jgi:hypothetical protein